MRMSKSEIKNVLLKEVQPLLKTLGTPDALITPDEAQKVLMVTTGPLRAQLQANVKSILPASQRLAYSFKTYRGRRGNSRYTVYTGPSYRKGEGGNLAHIFEYGTIERFHRVFSEDGKVKRVSVGLIKAKPFMRPAWENTKDGIISESAKQLVIIIEKRLNKAK